MTEVTIRIKLNENTSEEDLFNFLDDCIENKDFDEWEAINDEDWL